MDNAKAIAELTFTLKKLTRATSPSDSRVSDLLGSWAASHPRARGALQRAAQQSLRGWLEKEQAAVLNRFASSLIPGDGACELLITMNAPKRAFRALSRYFSARMREFKAGSPFGPLKRPICSRAAFTEAWASFARALTLGHVEYREGPPLTVALHWPLQRWAEYINSRPTLFNALDFSKPLHFIVRGGRVPHCGVQLGRPDHHARQFWGGRPVPGIHLAHWPGRVRREGHRHPRRVVEGKHQGAFTSFLMFTPTCASFLTAPTCQHVKYMFFKS